MSNILRFTRNKRGRDFVTGDIHGRFDHLSRALVAIGFNIDCDRLFSVGDLVDRGDFSHKALQWLDIHLFHPVCGNHDDKVIRYRSVDREAWDQQGGKWFWKLTEQEREQFAERFARLPAVIEVETSQGLVGIVHADPMVEDWSLMHDYVHKTKRGRDKLMWSRDRFNNLDRSQVKGVRAVIVGHNPVPEPLLLGNVLHIDTLSYGWKNGTLGKVSLINLETLQQEPAPRQPK